MLNQKNESPPKHDFVESELPEVVRVGAIACLCLAALVVISLAWHIEVLQRRLDRANHAIEVLDRGDPMLKWENLPAKEVKDVQ